MYTLVVVDMQAKFPKSLDKTVQLNCRRAVAKAIKNRASIVFLEFSNYGPTLPQLTKLTKDYDKVYHATKSGWDGSAEALKLVKEHGLAGKRFRVCGVYTDCCVQATLEGLHGAIKDAKIELIHKACGATSDHTQAGTIQTARKMPRVRVVEV
jgi:nicotinamidase-related amidase